MKTIKITDIEIHEPKLGFWGRNISNPVLNKEGVDVRYYLHPGQNLINIANKRARVTSNLLQMGWVHEYSYDKKMWYFMKL